MVAYGIGILPLILDLHDTHPPVTQPWYADDTGSGNNFADIRSHLLDLMVCVLPGGYFPEYTNIIFFVTLKNVPQEEAYLRGMGLSMVNESRYPGGFICDQAAEMAWIEEKYQGWTASMEVMTEVERRHL